MFTPLFDQQGIYAVLAKGMVATLLSHVNTLSVRGCVAKENLVGQVVEYYDLCPPEDFLSANRKKTGIARSGAD